MNEPLVQVGLAASVGESRFTLEGEFDIEGLNLGHALPLHTQLRAMPEGATVLLQDPPMGPIARGAVLRLIPRNPAIDTFLLHGFTIGASFHWEQKADLRFVGAVSLRARMDSKGPVLDVVNEVPIETYLVSVISSEMSAFCPPAMLRAHAIISRSWLLAQMAGRGLRPAPPPPTPSQFVRWYDREDHAGFDVCADDHCQRYQGITQAIHGAAADAVAATRGQVLTYGGAVCDARFSKCCGGMTEVFPSAWGDVDVPYLQSFPDDAGPTPGFRIPLTEEANAAAFITGAPKAFCHTTDKALLARILPGIDTNTRDFYRWEVHLSQEEVRGYIENRLGFDPGPILALRPLRRGPSGRITLLEIEGKKHHFRVGKELEIRRVLSKTHLYSSAFVVTPDREVGGVPGGFKLRGAGWGHGVGLCQIGAAVMADQGYDHGAILGHYYRGAALQSLY